MAEGRTSEVSNVDLMDSSNPKNAILFPHLNPGTISKPIDKAIVSVDLRGPNLVHLFNLENVSATSGEHGGTGFSESDFCASGLGESSVSCSRLQTVRRGDRLCQQRGARCYSRSRFSQDTRKGVRAEQGSVLCNTTPPQSSSTVRSSIGIQELQGSSLTLPSSESCANSLEGPSSDAAVGTLFDDFETHKVTNDEFAVEDDDGLRLSCGEAIDQPSTIIHLKLVSPELTRESISEEPSVQQMPIESESYTVLLPSTSDSFRGKKRKQVLFDDDEKSMEEESLLGSEDEDDLPLIVHCKRKSDRPIMSSDDEVSTMKQEVKKTYQRGNMTQFISSAASNQGDGVQRTRTLGSLNEYSGGKGRVLEKSCASTRILENGNEPERVKSRLAAGSNHRQRILLEEYERNNQVIRNTTGNKPDSGKKYRRFNRPNDGDSLKKVNLKRAVGQTKCFPSMQKSRVMRSLMPGPVSHKRARMKEFGANPRLISRVLRELTERKCATGRSSISFRCISHQNYYNGSCMVRFTKRLPARERVALHVPVGCRDDLELVGSELLELWKLQDDEVDELQKQVKQEMKHKRTEHIMPVVLQMSYEQIESAYEQVKKDMKTYEVTEEDSDLDDDEELPLEEDEDKDVEFLDEQHADKSKTGVEKSVDNLSTDPENETDENLHVRSYDIIVHDESSKTISCETVKYLEWRKSGKENQADAHDQNKNMAAKDSENEIHKAGNSPETVAEPAADTLQQTNYSRSRPKRHAVDYSPNAFAPIRLMEGKRLSGDRATQAKHHGRKSTEKKLSRRELHKTCTKKQNSSVTQSDVTEASQNEKTANVGVNCTNGSSERTPDPKENEVDIGPNLTEQQISVEPLTVQTSAPDCHVINRSEEETVDASKDESNAADVESEGEVPEILDVSEIPLSPATDSPSTLEELPTMRTDADASKPIPSAYEKVRAEYLRLSGLMQDDGIDTSFTSENGSNDGSKEAASDLVMEAPSDVDNSRFEDGDARFQDGQDCDLSQGRLKDSLRDWEHLGSELKTCLNMSDAACSVDTTKDRGGFTNMPRLQMQSSDAWNAEAEGLLAPPDLGLPAEYPDSRQQQQQPSTKPVKGL